MTTATAYTRLTNATANLDPAEQLEFLSRHRGFLRRLTAADPQGAAAWAAARPCPLGRLLVALAEVVDADDRWLLLGEAWGHRYLLDLETGHYRRASYRGLVEGCIDEEDVAWAVYDYSREREMEPEPMRACWNINPRTPYYE